MTDQIRSEEKELSSGNPSGAGVQAEDSPAACKLQGKGWLKGWLPMVICCAAPLLLLAAIPFLGLAFGSLAGVASGFLSLAAVVACPLGMYFTMRTIMKR